MTYIFKTGKYGEKVEKIKDKKGNFSEIIKEGKSIEQVALMDYLYLSHLSEYDNLNFFLKEEIKKISYPLNNFIPNKGCKACGRDATYFPLDIRVGEVFNPFTNLTNVVPIEVVTNLDDLRCYEHSKNPMIKGLSYTPIKFDILKAHSKEPKWVIAKIQQTLLEIAGFSGPKTKNNCDKFFKNLKYKGNNPEDKGFYQPGLF